MLVWFLTKDFADLCFLDNFFISFHFCQSDSVILFIQLVLLLIGAVSHNIDTPLFKSQVTPGVITTILFHQSNAALILGKRLYKVFRKTSKRQISSSSYEFSTFRSIASSTHRLKLQFTGIVIHYQFPPAASGDILPTNIFGTQRLSLTKAIWIIMFKSRNQVDS